MVTILVEENFLIGEEQKKRSLKLMSRTTRKHINYKTGRVEKTRDNKPRCQCCCNPRHSAFGNKKEKLTMQEKREQWPE